MRYIGMAMVLILICFDLNAAETVTPGARESLRGLSGVHVLIEDISPDAQADGLSKGEIQTAVELILRSAGIRILTVSETLATPSQSCLHIHVGTNKSKPERYALSVRLQLWQQVSLVQRPAHTMSAPTYMESGTGTFSSRMLRDGISEVIEPMVKTFANNFLAVNPR